MVPRAVRPDDVRRQDPGSGHRRAGQLHQRHLPRDLVDDAASPGGPHLQPLVHPRCRAAPGGDGSEVAGADGETRSPVVRRSPLLAQEIPGERPPAQNGASRVQRHQYFGRTGNPVTGLHPAFLQRQRAGKPELARSLSGPPQLPHEPARRVEDGDPAPLRIRHEHAPRAPVRHDSPWARRKRVIRRREVGHVRDPPVEGPVPGPGSRRWRRRPSRTGARNPPRRSRSPPQDAPTSTAEIGMAHFARERDRGEAAPVGNIPVSTRLPIDHRTQPAPDPDPPRFVGHALVPAVRTAPGALRQPRRGTTPRTAGPPGYRAVG